MKTTLIYFISGKGSSHEVNEVKMLANFFNKIYLIGCPKENESLYFRPNISFLHFTIRCKSTIEKIHSLLSIIPIWFKDSLSGLLNIEYQKNAKYRLASLLWQYNQAKNIQNSISTFSNKNDNTIWGSYWFNESTLTLAFLKRAGIIDNFFCRAHGRDLYEEREPKSGKLAYRTFVLKHIDSVHCISKHGASYLINRYPKYENKIHVNYLGSEDNGKGLIEPKREFIILSCAIYRNIKRLFLIAESIYNINFPVHWIHIGAMKQSDPTFPRFETALNKLKSDPNIIVTFKGNLKYEEIVKFYKENHIDLFVSVSETEGLPVSMMEAQSFGLPILSTEVGGCKEIVNSKTGFLLDNNFTSNEFKEKIELLNSNRNYFDRSEIRQNWDRNFNIYKNYKVFYKRIAYDE